MDVFILSAGLQQRFPANYTPKQLLKVGGETILERQLRQLKEHDLEATVITTNNEIKSNATKCLHPANNKSVLNSIQSSSHLWKNELYSF